MGPTCTYIKIKGVNIQISSVQPAKAWPQGCSMATWHIGHLRVEAIRIRAGMRLEHSFFNAHQFVLREGL